MAKRKSKIGEKNMANKPVTHGGEVTPSVKTVRIVGNAMVLTSRLPFATIQKMEKYSRNALCLIEENKDEIREVFRISTGKLSSISKYGVVFAEANSNGYATATVLFPENVTDKKAYVKDNFATTLFMLKDLEDAVATACAELEADFEKLDKEIIVED